MNQQLKLLGSKNFPSGTYRPISNAEVRLPSSYRVCPEVVIAERQIQSTLATVWSEDLDEEKLGHAQRALDVQGQDGRSDDEVVDGIAEEFASLRD